MALREDLNVQLLVNGDTCVYESISQIKVPLAGGGYGLLTNLHSMYSYFIKPTGITDVYEVCANAIFNAGGLSGGNAIVSFVDDGYFDGDVHFTLNNGAKRIIIVQTPKALTIGERYHINDL